MTSAAPGIPSQCRRCLSLRSTDWRLAIDHGMVPFPDLERHFPRFLLAAAEESGRLGIVGDQILAHVEISGSRVSAVSQAFSRFARQERLLQLVGALRLPPVRPAEPVVIDGIPWVHLYRLLEPFRCFPILFRFHHDLAEVEGGDGVALAEWKQDCLGFSVLPLLHKRDPLID